MTVTNADMVAVLEKARSLLATDDTDDGHVWICHAIYESDSRKNWHQASPAAKKVISIIQERLGFFDAPQYRNDVESWLLSVAKVPRSQLTVNRVQAYRHAWVKELIKEFS